MAGVKRIYVEKKEPYAVKAKELKEELKNYLGIEGIRDVRVMIRYDVERLSDSTFEVALHTVFSEPPVDVYYREIIEIPEDGRVFSVEYLPGQFDQRADSAEQCVKFLKEDEQPVIKTAVTYVITGDVSDEEFEKIKAYCINPVDSRQTGMVKPDTLLTEFDEPADVICFDGFVQMSELMNHNYAYIYSWNRLKGPEDERRIIENATLNDMDILEGILSRYTLGGMTRGILWSQAVKEGIYLKIFLKIKELLDYWEKRLDEEQSLV